MYQSFDQWFAGSEIGGVSLGQIVLENEMQLSELEEGEIYDTLLERWRVMEGSARKALDDPEKYVGTLVSGQSAKQNRYAKEGGFTGGAVNRMMAMALSASEVNASMGRICAAPTAGACGVLPAVLLTALEQTGAGEPQLLEALLVAAGVGSIITMNATVSGAEGGCQAECGSAAAMSAAAAVTLKGGTNEMVGNAVSLALMNCMGLVCDPVAGLVQIPCSFRNASQSVNALLSADLALAGQDSVIPPDEAVQSMYRVGRQLPVELRETAQGGVADTPTGHRLSAEFNGAL